MSIRHDKVDATVTFAISVVAGKQRLETPGGKVRTCCNKVDIGNPWRDELIVLNPGPLNPNTGTF